MNLARFDFSAQARLCYETLALLVPDAPLAGLYTDGASFFVVCTDASTRQVEGQSFKAWFDATQRPAGFPITVTDAAPANSVAVQLRSIEEIAIGKGHAVTLDALFTSL